jgi:hypothetical protein
LTMERDFLQAVQAKVEENRRRLLWRGQRLWAYHNTSMRVAGGQPMGGL